MKKTININLGGYPFTINDDAFDLLSRYFDSLKSAFAVESEEDASDLTADIEDRCAEILREQLAPGAIITLGDVKRIIERVGQPEEIVENTEYISTEPSDKKEYSRSTTAGEAGPVPPPIRKRLFRDPQNEMIGGVCSGIGAYLNVDPTWIRLITVGLAIISKAWVFPLYIILWIVLPAARTPLQRMQMRGEEPTLSNIGRTVNSAYSDSDDKEVNNSFKSFANGLNTIFAFIGKGIIAIFVLCCALVLFACGLGIIGCLIGLLGGAAAFAVWPVTLLPGITALDTRELWLMIGGFLSAGSFIYLICYAIWTSIKNRPVRRSTLVPLLILLGTGIVTMAISWEFL